MEKHDFTLIAGNLILRFGGKTRFFHFGGNKLVGKLDLMILVEKFYFVIFEFSRKT